MIKRYRLVPSVWHEKPLFFTLDTETGELGGIGAERVQVLVNDAMEVGQVIINPIPSMYPIDDPLKNPDQLAAILGRFWQLSEDLRAVYPGSDPL